MCFLCVKSDNDGNQSLSLCLGGIGNTLMNTWDGSCPGIFFYFTELFVAAKTVLIHTCCPRIIIRITWSDIVSRFAE